MYLLCFRVFVIIYWEAPAAVWIAFESRDWRVARATCWSMSLTNPLTLRLEYRRKGEMSRERMAFHRSVFSRHRASREIQTERAPIGRAISARGGRLRVLSVTPRRGGPSCVQDSRGSRPTNDAPISARYLPNLDVRTSRPPINAARTNRARANHMGPIR